MSRQHRQDEQHFIPDQLAGFRIGDRVSLSKVSTPLTGTGSAATFSAGAGAGHRATVPSGVEGSGAGY